MKRKLFSLLVLLLTAVTGAWAQTTYTVAGSNSAMFGSAWDADATANDMTKNGDGTYSITYTNVYLDDDVQYKVLKDHSWGEAYPAVNRVITIAEAGTYTVTIHFNPTTHEVYETMPGVAPSYNLTVGENAQGSVKFYVGEAEVTKAEEGATVTVVITPNTGWVVNQPSGQWYAAVAKAPRRVLGNIDLLSNIELSPVEGQTNAWTFVMQRANAEISCSYKKLLSNTGITIEDITALTYSGVAQEPVVTVKDGSVVLTKDVDYTVAYSNNTNAALATAAQNAPTVTITAVATSDKYAGETTKTFTINKKALTVKAEDKSVTFGDDAPTYTETYDGFVNNETKAVLSGTLALTCSYVKNQTGAGNYDITPSGLTSSNYDITFTKGTLTVGKKALEDGFIANIASLVYNGVAQEPAPVVTFNGMTLEKDVDYTVSYENNVNVGTATATVTALANSTKYSGTASKTFTITKKALTVTADNKSVTFGDDAPTYTESYDGFVNNETKAVLSGTLALTCSYVKNQTGAGNYDITPSGYTSNNYDITFTKGTLTVGAKALEDGFIANIASLVYNGVAQEPAPVVTFHEMTLAVGTDYTVAYSNNTNAGTATVKVTAKEGCNYSGEASATFTISPKALENSFFAEMASQVYAGQELQPAPVLSFNDMTLVKGTDYELNYTNNVNVGSATVTATGKGNYSGEASANFSITQKSLTVTAENKQVTYGDDTPQFTVVYEGFSGSDNEEQLGGELSFTCNYVKDNSGVGEYDINPSGLTSSNYSITFAKGTLTVVAKALENTFIGEISSPVYNAQEQQPAPELTFHSMTLVKGTDYELSYANNINVGTATLTATGKGNYSGEASATFSITPAQITSLTLAQTEFVYNLFDPQLQTAQVGELKAGELVVPATDYEISDNTATNLGDYVAKVTAKNNFQGVLTADYHIVKEQMGVEAGDSKTGKETGGVTMTVTVVDRTSQTLSIDVVNVPENKKVTVDIPAQINGWDVTAISDGAVPDNVTDVFMPNTGENPITVSDAALGIAKVHVPVQLLDDYAAQLAQHVEVKKLVSEVTQTTKRFWTFSSGVDVELQKELSANIVKIGKSGELISQPIGSQIVKANNGVMLEGEQDTEYELVALPAVSLGNDYEGNLLEPVIASKHYAAGQGYYVLKNGEFHAIADNNASMPSCKAVLHMNGNNSRVLKFRGIDDETSGIGAALIVKRGAGAVYFDLNGRQLNGVPTQKGVYILNGRKVVIK